MVLSSPGCKDCSMEPASRALAQQWPQQALYHLCVMHRTALAVRLLKLHRRCMSAAAVCWHALLALGHRGFMIH